MKRPRPKQFSLMLTDQDLLVIQQALCESAGGYSGRKFAPMPDREECDRRDDLADSIFDFRSASMQNNANQFAIVSATVGE